MSLFALTFAVMLLAALGLSAPVLRGRPLRIGCAAARLCRAPIARCAGCDRDRHFEPGRTASE